LAEAHDVLYVGDIDHTPGRLASAKAALDSAFRLNPDSGEAHLAMATHLYWGYFNYEHARDELRIARQTLPNNARLFEVAGYIDRRQGRWLDATRNLERATELDPRNARILSSTADTYQDMRDYRQAKDRIDHLIAMEPNDDGYKLWRAWIDVIERADTEPLQALLGRIVTKNPATTATFLGRALFLLALPERDTAAADRVLAAMADNTLIIKYQGRVAVPGAYAKGLVARMNGDPDNARAAFNAARTQEEKVIRAKADDTARSAGLCSLGLIDAALGRRQEALNEAREAVELLPITKNALDGVEMLYFYAAVCAQTGERDIAIKQLDDLVKIPNGVTYGELRLDPFWDPLRGDPRFEKLLEEARQPVVLK
jgi:tetratricopeptide (TPR) repeat protein